MPRRSKSTRSADPLATSSREIRGVAVNLDFRGAVEVLALLALGPQDVWTISLYLGQVYANTSRLLTRLERAGWVRTTKDRQRRLKHLGATVRVTRRATVWQIALSPARGASLTLGLPVSAIHAAGLRVLRVTR